MQSSWKTASLRCALHPPAAAPVLVDTPAGLRRAAAALARCNLLGFDTETKPVFDKGAPAEPPALLQIAGMRVNRPDDAGDDAGGSSSSSRSSNKENNSSSGSPLPAPPRQIPIPEDVYIFDLLQLLPAYATELSTALSPLLSSPDTRLLGVGIAPDLRALSRFYGRQVPCFAAPVRGVQELSGLGGSRARWGLRQLAAHYAGVPLPKRLARSNWARRPLRDAQLEYAARDARVALAIYRAAGSAAFSAAPQEVDLASDAVWVCRVCAREFYSRRQLRRACEESCGVVRSEEKKLTYKKSIDVRS